MDHVPLEHDFHLTVPVQVLLLGWSMAVWVAVGIWWQIYDRIDSVPPAQSSCATPFANVCWAPW